LELAEKPRARGEAPDKPHRSDNALGGFDLGPNRCYGSFDGGLEEFSDFVPSELQLPSSDAN
jgi:hypothetical protein